MTRSSPNHTRQIAHLNDAFRTSFLRGTVCVTAGLHELGEAFLAETLAAVRDFDDFSNDNDPYGEHDFGALEVQGRRIFWKIDYFDPTMLYHSEDPANVAVTRRVLTIMLAQEY